MNDTETEARHLLAAATEDMPPGIDLLTGFSAARRRDWARRRQGRAVLAAGIAAAAAAVAAVTLTVGSAPPALAAVTTALTRTLTQSYHVAEQESMYYIYNGRIRYPSHGTCTKVADPVRHLEAYSGSACSAEREVGAYTYIYIPDTPHPGRHWWRTPTGSILHLGSPSIDWIVTDTPQQMLSEIKKAATVTVAGPVSGPGWTGTRYAFSSFTPYPKLKGAPPGMGEKTSGYVDVDRQGRARALVLTIRDTGPINVFVTTQALTFSDFGAPVTIVPPPADQTFSRP